MSDTEMNLNHFQKQPKITSEKTATNPNIVNFHIVGFPGTIDPV